MAIRKRMIDPAFWDDPKVGKLTDSERLFIVACISIADDDGRLVADPAYLRSIIYKYQDKSVEEIKNIRDSVCNALRGFQFYSVNGEDYIQLYNWKKYQTLRADLYKASLYPKPPRNANVTDTLRNSNDSVTQVSKKVSKKERKEEPDFNKEFKKLKKLYPKEEDIERIKSILKHMGFAEVKIDEALGRK